MKRCGTTHAQRTGWIAAVLIFLAWTVYGTWPLAAHLRDVTQYAWGDNLLNAYILRWNLHQLPLSPLRLFDASFYYPARNTLALSENLLGLSLLFWPVDLLFDDTLLLANLVILFSFFSLALTAFGVFRSWTGSWLLAMLAGMWIGFAPPRYTQLVHLQLLSYQPMLLGIWFAERWLRTLRPAHAAGFFLCVYVQFLFGIYLFVFNLVLLAVLMPALLLLRRPWPEPRRLGRQGLCGLLLLAAAVYPLYQPYRYIKRTYGIQVHLKDILNTGACLTDYLAVSSVNRLWGFLAFRFPNRYSPYPWENGIGLHPSLYLALLVMLPAGVLLLSRRCRRRRTLPPFAALFVALVPTAFVLFLLSFGPCMHLFTRPLTAVPTLWTLFYHVFPGFEGMRVPPRVIFPLSLCLAALTLLPAGWLYQSLTGRRRLIFQTAAACLLLFVMFESRVMPPLYKPVPAGHEIPRVYEVLRAQPRAPLFIWPAALGDENSYLYLYYNTWHWYPMMNGTSGHLPQDQGGRLTRLIGNFPDAAELRFLRRRRIHYVIYHAALQADPARREADRRTLLALEREGKLTPLFSDGTDYLWRIPEARVFSDDE